MKIAIVITMIITITIAITIAVKEAKKCCVANRETASQIGSWNQMAS